MFGQKRKKLLVLFGDSDWGGSWNEPESEDPESGDVVECRSLERSPGSSVTALIATLAEKEQVIAALKAQLSRLTRQGDVTSPHGDRTGERLKSPPASRVVR